MKPWNDILFCHVKTVHTEGLQSKKKKYRVEGKQKIATWSRLFFAIRDKVKHKQIKQQDNCCTHIYFDTAIIWPLPRGFWPLIYGLFFESPRLTGKDCNYRNSLYVAGVPLCLPLPSRSGLIEHHRELHATWRSGRRHTASERCT